MCYTAETSVLATKHSFANIRYAMPRGYLPWGLRCFLQHPYCAPTAGGANLRYSILFLSYIIPFQSIIFTVIIGIFNYNNFFFSIKLLIFSFLFIHSLQSKKWISIFPNIFSSLELQKNIWYALFKFQIFRTEVIIITYLWLGNESYTLYTLIVLHFSSFDESQGCLCVKVFIGCKQI